MKKKLPWKTWVFYAGSISFVLILFKVVTVYGTANLKASPAIDGRYRITSENLPECLKSENLSLIIQQSGVYLNGSLVSVNPQEKLATAVEKKPSLAGRWNNEDQTQPLNLKIGRAHV